MAVFIDKEKCIGCGRCCMLCPGNIIRKDGQGKACLKDPGECWSCTSCMKECPVGAISLVLPPQLSGSGGKMSLKKEGTVTRWTVEKADGEIFELITDTEEANNY